MQVKRFVAADMRRALELVRQELGPDAIILSSNRNANGVELLTTMGSDSELMELQQQPLGKLAFSSASPMISDDAWSASPAILQTSAKQSFPSQASSASAGNAFKMGKSGQQLAAEIEQARLRMMGSRKVEDSAREFLVGKNTRVNAGIPRHSPQQKEASRYGESKKETKQAASIAERARSATSINPIRSEKEEADYTRSIADRARGATTVNPTRAEIEQARAEAVKQLDNDKYSNKENSRPASSQVTIPPRRIPVPRPVLVEKKQQPMVKPKSQMTAAERYPLIDDEPLDVVQEAPVHQSAQPAAVEDSVELNSKVKVDSDVAVSSVNPEASSVTANPVVDQAVIDHHQYLLKIQAEIADMRSLLEKQLSRPIEVNINTAAADLMNVNASTTNHIINDASVSVLAATSGAVGNPESTSVNIAANVNPAIMVEKAEEISASGAQTIIAPVIEPVAVAPVILNQVASTQIAQSQIDTASVIPDSVVVSEPVVKESTAAEDHLGQNISIPIASVSVIAEVAPTETTSQDTTIQISNIQTPDVLDPVIPTLEAVIPALSGGAVTSALQDKELEDSKEHILELQSEIADMRFLLEQQFNRLDKVNAPAPSSSIMGSVARRLVRAGLPEDIVSRVVSEGTKINNLREAWPEAMANLSRHLPVVGRDIVDEGGIFAFVGPTGVGKTTTIGKLAARYVLKHGADKVALITTDTYRIASHEQLRSIARILRVPVKVVDENNSLEKILESLSHCSVVLIDTAGFRHGDPQLKNQLEIFSGLPQVKTFVVLSTNCQAQMLKASVHAHGAARLQGCVLTKLDETSSLGEALGVVIKGWLPVAYTTDGQDIPKDIDVARGHQLVAKAIAMVKKMPTSNISQAAL